MRHDDYSYMTLLARALENTSDPDLKKKYYAELVHSEAHRDYHMGSIKQFKSLVQIDERPDTEIKEAKWDLFKISMSDIAQNSLGALLNGISLLNQKISAFYLFGRHFEHKS